VFLFLEVVVGSGGGTIADDNVCGGLGLVCIAAAAVVLVTCFGFFTYLLFLAFLCCFVDSVGCRFLFFIYNR